MYREQEKQRQHERNEARSWKIEQFAQIQESRREQNEQTRANLRTWRKAVR
jgi:hypothetical protein